MTVKELIAELRGADPAAVVMVQFVRQRKGGVVDTQSARLNSVGWKIRVAGFVELAHVTVDGEPE